MADKEPKITELVDEDVEEPEADDEATTGTETGTSQPASSSASKKKKKKKKKKQNQSAETGTDTDNADESKQPQLDPATMEALQRQIALLQRNANAQSEGPKVHKFWLEQPVPQFDEPADTPEGVIAPDVKPEDIPVEPVGLPAGFEWSTVDLLQTDQLDELYDLLNKNYVEDDDNMFRRDFLKWALMPPEWKAVWHLGIRNTKNQKLLAFISAVPAQMRMREHSQLLVEINFLCVHKRLRQKRVAPSLIREITRLVNLEGTFQACYTGGSVIPRPVSSCRYFHRSLNPKKLIDIKFSSLPRKETMRDHLKKFKLPQEPTLKGLKPLEERHCDQAHALVNNYLKKFVLAPDMTLEEFKHWLLPREDVVYSFVVEDDEGNVTDFTSFYSLPSTIVNHPDHSILRAAYSYYNVGVKHDLHDLMKNALILARNLDFDVFNALHLMDNEEFLADLLFGPGDGLLHYYLYNYRVHACKPEEIGLVLL